ncbi:hypothetical protein CXF80_07905 [Shewanella sp. Actino-trap-3]|jgi:hypothetical protein|uniref:hypothetical protein n=1 Tax=Shewanella sp. Actino-trap-3 TaxID=2058331 RepID=UPI000C33B608|nr:hypothetical protein [Shewanella sp. Actino-trap-3]PKG78248.1 hypothetical protein CXF80_07905 [Shewanella sp. Actino-trap-3]
MEFEIILKLITGVGAIFGIALTLSHLFAQKSTGKLKKYEIFKEIKELIEINEPLNYSTACVALGCLVKRELSLLEIKWFINTPNAFKYLYSFSQQGQYIKISNDGKSFVFKEKYVSWKSRLFEATKLFSLYSLLAFVGIYTAIFGLLHSDMKSDLIFLCTIGLGLVLFGLFFLNQLVILSSTKHLLKQKFSNEDFSVNLQENIETFTECSQSS